MYIVLSVRGTGNVCITVWVTTMNTSMTLNTTCYTTHFYCINQVNMSAEVVGWDDYD